MGHINVRDVEIYYLKVIRNLIVDVDGLVLMSQSKDQLFIKKIILLIEPRCSKGSFGV
jgi:hypothetical protein